MSLILLHPPDVLEDVAEAQIQAGLTSDTETGNFIETGETVVKILHLTVYNYLSNKLDY